MGSCWDNGRRHPGVSAHGNFRLRSTRITAVFSALWNRVSKKSIVWSLHMTDGAMT